LPSAPPEPASWRMAGPSSRTTGFPRSTWSTRSPWPGKEQRSWPVRLHLQYRPCPHETVRAP